MKKTGKDALLAWCKNKTQGYAGVDVSNFSASWRDGLALCALVHSIRPSLIPWESLNRSNEIENLNIAFNAAEKIGVPKLLDAEDMSPGPPEPFSVTTYLGTFYHAASKLDSSGPSTTPGAAKTPASDARPAEPERPKSVVQTNARPAAPVAATATKPPVVDSTPPPTQLNGTTCVKCSKTASGMMVDWGGNLFHQECFKCTGCNRAFRKNCLNIEGMPYCDTCGRKAFVQSRLLKHGLSASDAPARSPSGSISSNSTNNTTKNTSTNTLTPPSASQPANRGSTSTASVSSTASANSSTTTHTRSPATSISSNATSTARSPATSVSTGTSSISTASSTVTSSTTTPTTSQSRPSASTSNPSITVTQSTNTGASTAAQNRTPTSSTSTPVTSPPRSPSGSTITAPTSTTSASATPKDTIASNAANRSNSGNSASSLSTSGAKLATPSNASSTTATTRKESVAVAYNATASRTASGSANLGSGTSNPSVGAPKGESILERELREQREKEEELAAARARAKSTAVPVTTAATSTTASTTSTVVSSTSPAPKPSTDANTTSTTANNTVAQAQQPALKPTTSARSLGKSKTIHLGSTSASTAPTTAATTSTANSKPATPTAQQTTYKSATVKPTSSVSPSTSTGASRPAGESIMEREMREMREREEELARARQTATEIAKSSSRPSLSTASSTSTQTASTTSTVTPTATTTSTPKTSVSATTSPAPAATTPSVVATSGTTSATTSTTSGSASKAEEERKAAEEAEKAFLASNKTRTPATSVSTPSTISTTTAGAVTGAPARPTSPPPADLVANPGKVSTLPPASNKPDSRPRLVSAMPALYNPKPTIGATVATATTTQAERVEEKTLAAPTAAEPEPVTQTPTEIKLTANGLPEIEEEPKPMTVMEMPAQPPAPSRAATAMPGQIHSDDIAVATSSNAVASSSNSGLDLAEDVQYVEGEDVEISEKVRRATTQLRRVNVSKVADGHKGWLKRRDRTAAIKLFWQPLWFSLQDSRLLYYKEAKSHNTLASEHPPEGFLSLQFIETIRISSSSDRKFVIESPSAKWDLKAPTKEDAAAWVEAINDAVTIYNLSEKSRHRASRPVFGQDHAEDLLMQGHLDRLTSLGFSRNWWLLQDGMLFYFSSQHGKRLGRIPLYHCEFAPYEMSSNANDAIRAFCITTHTGEKVILAAKDEMEMHRWLNCMLRQRIIIEEAIDMISF